MSAPLSTARTARLVATGYSSMNSVLPVNMQQKYCDQGWSRALLTITRPILPGAQLLGLRRKAEEGIDLALGVELDRLRVLARDPVDVLGRVQPDIGRHAGQKHVLARAESLDADALALEVGDRPDALIAEQLEAARVDARQHRQALARVHRDHQRRDEVGAEVDLAARDLGRLLGPGLGRDVADVGEALDPQQIPGRYCGSDADARDLAQADRGHLGRRLVGERPGGRRRRLQRRLPIRWPGNGGGSVRIGIEGSPLRSGAARRPAAQFTPSARA